MDGERNAAFVRSCSVVVGASAAAAAVSRRRRVHRRRGRAEGSPRSRSAPCYLELLEQEREGSEVRAAVSLSHVPIYEYRCPNGDTFELFQKMTDPPPTACPICGAGPVEKLFFPVAVHFKGSGFYSTDYGRGKSRKDGDSGAPSEKPADKPAEKAATREESDKPPAARRRL